MPWWHIRRLEVQMSVDEASELFVITHVSSGTRSTDVQAPRDSRKRPGDARKRLSVESPGAGPESSCCKSGMRPGKCNPVVLVDVPRSLGPDQFCSAAEIRSPHRLCLSSTLLMPSQGNTQRPRVDPVLLSHRDERRCFYKSCRVGEEYDGRSCLTAHPFSPGT